jgi:hypothetical protein
MCNVGVITMLPLLLLAKLFGIYLQMFGYLLRGKPQCSEVVEAVDPIKWAPT